MRFRGATCALLAAVATYGGASTSSPVPQVPSPPSGGPVPTKTVTVAPPPSIPAPPPLPKGTRIRLTFAPPLDRPLTYYFSDETIAEGHLLQFTGEFTVRFTRAGALYRMEARPRIFGARPALARAPELQQLLRPLVLRLDSNGKLVRVDEADAYWQRTEALLERLARRPGVDILETGRIRVLLLTIRRVGPGGRAAALAAKLLPATSLAGLDMAVGETRQGPAEDIMLPFPIPRARLTRRYDSTLAEATAATARVEMVARFAPTAAADAGADIAEFVHQAGTGVKLSQTVRQEALRDSGLTRRYKERTAFESASGALVAAHVVHLDLVEVR